MVLRLIGHYNSPFVRRVGISLHVLGMPFERELLSVFGDAEAMRAFNPLVRVPALVLDDGTCLIDSAAILDHLDEMRGARARTPARPRQGPPRRPADDGAGDRHRRQGHRRRLRTPQAHRQDRRGLDRPLPRAAGGRAGRVGAPLCRHPAGPGPSHAIRDHRRCHAGIRAPAPTRNGSCWPLPGSRGCLGPRRGGPAFKACLPSLEEIGGSPAEAKAALLRLQGTLSPA